MRWPWSLPERDVSERIARAAEVRERAKCLLDQIQRAIDAVEPALGGGDDAGGIRRGGATEDQR